MPTVSVTNLIVTPPPQSCHPRSPLHTMGRHCCKSLVSFWPLKNVPQLADGPRLYARWQRRALMVFGQTMRFAITLKPHWLKFSKLPVSPTQLRGKWRHKRGVSNTSSSKSVTGPASNEESKEWAVSVPLNTSPRTLQSFNNTITEYTVTIKLTTSLHFLVYFAG